MQPENIDSRPIDVVYTWVNANYPGYAEIRDHFASQYGIKSNPERDRDPFDLLKYSLRALERFAKWKIGRIYIITMRPQIPSWLDLDGNSSIVKIIHHDEIFERSADLPTFNSNSICFNIPRIRDLSPYYLLFDDDFFLGSNAFISDFVNKDGKIKIYFDINCGTPGAGEKESASSSFLRSLAHTNDVLNHNYKVENKRLFFRHVPLLIDKQLLEKELNHSAVQKTIRNRFRHESDLVFEHYYNYSLLNNSDPGAVVVPFWKRYFCTSFHRISNDFASQYYKLKMIKWTRPKFFCLNDDLGSNPNRKVIDLVSTFLNSYYPEKSKFER